MEENIMYKHCDKGYTINIKSFLSIDAFTSEAHKLSHRLTLKTFGGIDTLRQEQLIRRKFFQQPETDHNNDIL